MGRGFQRGRFNSNRGRSNRGRGAQKRFAPKEASERHDIKTAENVTDSKRFKAEEFDDSSSSSSSSDSEAETPAYNQLLSLLNTNNRVEKVVTSSESESSEAEEDVEEASDEENEEDDDHEEEGEVEEEQEDAEGEDELIEDEESDSEAEENEETDSDPFVLHYERELGDSLLETLMSEKPYKSQELNWKALGRMVVQLPNVPVRKKEEDQTQNKLLLLEDSKHNHVSPGTLPECKSGKLLQESGIRSQLWKSFPDSTREKATVNSVLSEQQAELLSLMSEYRDVYFPENAGTEELRTVYCIHALNHALKSRDRVLQHNTKLKTTPQAEYRDQGLVRPRILILLPTRHSAVKVFETMSRLLLPEKGQVVNKQRFYEEFGDEDDADKEKEKKKNRKPEDHELLFAGNTDDSFRVGIAVAKRTLKMYAGFYSADILLASPLGLKTILTPDKSNASNSSEDFDFLCSIEMLIMDQTDVLYMQNWDHVLQIFQHLHLQPREQHGTDLNRVRLWALNGFSAHYRQNLIFSSVPLPEASALFNRRGTNFAGKIRIENPVPSTSASVCNVLIQMPQAFHRFSTTSAAQCTEDRFQFFIKKMLPQYRSDSVSHTLIYIPSYYDYVRVRNHLHREEVNFGQACEYTPDGKLAQVRNRFFLGKRRLLLYTERLHFYRRLTIKGIRHIVFYQLPTYPHFYPELLNLMQDNNQYKKFRGDRGQTCTVMYSTYDAPRLTGIVGSIRAAQMLTSDRPVHLFVSSEDGS